MSPRMFSHRVTLFLLATLMILSCSISGSPVSTVPPQPTDTQAIETQPAATEIVQPTSTSEATQAPSATSPGPSCTILQNLNLRSGPGTAYRPPIRVLPTNSVVTPLGFAPQGIPGGSWAYVQVPPNQDKGWVSAGSQFISCNIDLSKLPAVPFGTPPPPPLPNSTQTSNPDGNGFCIDPDSGFVCVGVFSDESLFQFKILQNGTELNENDGVEKVTFNVNNKDGETVYTVDEANAAYCVFGGNGPCNPWTVEDGVYKWSPGGTPVEAGDYQMEVFATVNGDTSRWAVTFTLKLP
jgi:SH3 domain-containing protein